MAGVDGSLVNRVERGRDARLSTWLKLFESLGYSASWKLVEDDDEWTGYIADEKYARRERQAQGLERRW